MTSAITAAILREILSYDPETGIFRWRKSRKGVTAGMSAGSLGAYGYWRITINGKQYRAQRLAWLYMTGEWPVGVVDHENRVKVDNRWTNLRDATKSQNGANAKRWATNTSGFKGVHWFQPTGKKTGFWCAHIMVRGKRMNLGYFKTPEEAHAAYAAAAREHFGEFAAA